MSEHAEAGKARIQEIEALMYRPDFWQDSARAQALIQELQDLKAETQGGSKYDKNEAIVSIVAGAGGDDAEDFARLLFEMYGKFVEKRGWGLYVLHENRNDHAGYRNITFEIGGKGSYGLLRHETGVHRLVRLSPFNAKSQRHTSFALVDVVPKLREVDAAVTLNPDDLDVQFARSSGPGGQNVNKRETAVRIVHRPTNIAVHVESERSQEANRNRAMEILRGKIFQLLEEEREKELSGLTEKPQKIEWGSQIRSYVLHPYQMVKDHRSSVEVRNAEAVLAGDIEVFLNTPVQGKDGQS